jgi:signal peptidase II
MVKEETTFTPETQDPQSVPAASPEVNETETPAVTADQPPPDPGPIVIPTDTPAQAEQPPTRGQILTLFIVAGIILIADQVTKRLVEQTLPLGTSTAPFAQLADIFQFTHTTNTGAAFGLFPNGGNLFALAAIIVSVVIVIYNFRLPAGHLLLRVALGLQLGGALGNLIDRARQGYVTDFFDVGPVPIFNIADAAVVTGVAIMALIIFLESRQEQRAAAARAAAAPLEAPDMASAPLESPPRSTPSTILPAQTTDEPGTH